MERKCTNFTSKKYSCQIYPTWLRGLGDRDIIIKLQPLNIKSWHKNTHFRKLEKYEVGCFLGYNIPFWCQLFLSLYLRVLVYHCNFKTILRIEKYICDNSTLWWGAHFEDVGSFTFSFGLLSTSVLFFSLIFLYAQFQFVCI